MRLDHCFTSPLLRARQTADILCQPHGLQPTVLDELTECDLGHWEGLDWQTIRAQDPESYLQFQTDPSQCHPSGGESYQGVFNRVWPFLEWLLAHCQGQHFLVVSHHAVLRVSLACLLGLPISQARQVSIANGSLSLVVRQGTDTTVQILNRVGHLQGLERSLAAP